MQHSGIFAQADDQMTTSWLRTGKKMIARDIIKKIQQQCHNKWNVLLQICTGQLIQKKICLNLKKKEKYPQLK